MASFWFHGIEGFTIEMVLEFGSFHDIVEFDEDEETVGFFAFENTNVSNGRHVGFANEPE